MEYPVIIMSLQHCRFAFVKEKGVEPQFSQNPG